MSYINDTMPPCELKPSQMHRMQLGKKYWGVSIDEIPEESVYKNILQRYIDNLKQNIENGIGILFYGIFGCGKTSAAAILGKAVIAYGGTALFIEVQQLSDMKISNVMFDENTTLWKRMQDVDLLILDDLGGEHGKNWGLIERILRYRLNNNKTTIATANDMKAVAKKYGESLLTVLKVAMCPVKVTAFDWRGKEEKKLIENVELNDN